MQKKKSISVKFNPDHWFFSHARPENVEALLQEEAEIVGYLPTFGTIIWHLKDYESAGFKVWNTRSVRMQSTLPREGGGDMAIIVTKKQLEETFLPITCDDVAHIDPNDFRVDDHYWNTFGKSEIESAMRWFMIRWQQHGNFTTGVKNGHTSENMCLDGYLTDLGDKKFAPTILSLRKLAGGGYYKPL